MEHHNDDNDRDENSDESSETSFFVDFPLGRLWCRAVYTGEDWLHRKPGWALREVRWALVEHACAKAEAQRRGPPEDHGHMTGAWFSAHDWAALRGVPLLEDIEYEGSLGPLVEQIRGALKGGERPRLAPEGSAFQLRVWRALCLIPAGETRTYGELAAQIGCHGGARAVGGANRVNPIMVLIPCHRVVAAGDIGGYAYGVEVKRALLELEGVVMCEGAPKQLTLNAFDGSAACGSRPVPSTETQA